MVVYRLMGPVVLVIIGLVMVLKNLFHLNFGRVKVPNEKRMEELIVFSGKKLVVQKEFLGMDAEAVFGGLTVDLRGAEITQDVSVDALAVFGGVEIFLPENVTVKFSDMSLFGGCSNTRKKVSGDGPTVYVNATAMFGGVEVK